MVLWQTFSALLLWALADEHWAINPQLVAALYLAVCQILNSLVFLRLRGRHYAAFRKPAVLLAVLTIAPGMAIWIAHWIGDLIHKPFGV